LILRLVRHYSFGIALLLTALLAATPLGATTHKRTTKSASTKPTNSKSAAHSKGKHRKSSRVAKKSWKTKGQHGIQSDRTREIQEALIRGHYLTGEANGEWDNRTQEAMRRYQAANGWQSKVLPDSRALIKLGLGPDHSNVLNPETAATSPYLPGGGEKSNNAVSPATSAARAQ
jgi:peptidoglycan hydrolase-like protein with peptidoglycan-binding domain